MNLKPFVNNKDLYDAFLEEIENRIGQARTKLENRSELEEVYRAQGEVKALKALLQLKESING